MKFVGFIVGAILGLGLSWLILGFEITGGPSTGCHIQILGFEVFAIYGIFADLVPAGIYVFMSIIAGAFGAVVASRLAAKPPVHTSDR